MLRRLIRYFSERRHLRELYSKVVVKPMFERELEEKN
jgi:hypothetical protein